MEGCRALSLALQCLLFVSMGQGLYKTYHCVLQCQCLFGGDEVRNKVLGFIFIPVLFVWAVVLLVHRSDPRFYDNVVSRIVDSARIGVVMFTACMLHESGYEGNDPCFPLFDTQNRNVIRLLRLFSDDHIADQHTDSYTRDFAA